MSQFVQLEVRPDGIGIITFNRPDALNALNSEILLEFWELCKEIEKNPAIHVVIVTGAGEKAFIAGADIREMSSKTTAEGLEFARLGQSAFRQLERMPQPVIAAVNGFALGGGCELVLACDLIYASENAKFGQPEVKLGIMPGFGGTQRLSRLIGKAKAKEMIFTGELIDARKALALGLVNEVFPAPELLSAVLKIAASIAKRGKSAVAQSKRVIEEGQDLSLDAALELERSAFGILFGSEDQKEGMRAFLEKRDPRFKH
ncbi:MAG: enoyl-CoA hydratase/isomerase family protein [Deltaproteobacteria bacterium]|nr:enoyl-CoA hydratase/isomerase family protein [Deltaproteobacteria bacterium]